MKILFVILAGVLICLFSVIFFSIGLFIGKILAYTTGIEQIYGVPLPVIVALIFMSSVKYKVDFDDFDKL